MTASSSPSMIRLLCVSCALVMALLGCAPADRPHTAQDSARQASVATQQAQAVAVVDQQAAAAAAITAASLTALADEQAKQAEEVRQAAAQAERVGRLDEARAGYIEAAKLLVESRTTGQLAAEARGRAAAAAATAAEDARRVQMAQAAQEAADWAAADERIRVARAEADARNREYALWGAVGCTILAGLGLALIVAAIPALTRHAGVVSAIIVVMAWIGYACVIWAIWVALGAVILLAAGVIAALAQALPHLIRDRLAVQQEPAAEGPATHADFSHLPLAARWVVGHFLDTPIH